MRILHIISGFAEKYGGIAQVVYNLSSTQASFGHKVTIAASTRQGEENEVLRPNGVKLVISLQDKVNMLWNSHSFKLYNDAKDLVGNSDIVHVHGIWNHSSFVGSRVSYILNKPYIITPHGSLAPWCLAQKRIKKKIYMAIVQKKQLLRANLIHAISDAEANDIRDILGETKIRTVPNGVSVDTNIKINEVLDFWNSYPCLRGKRYVLFLGRLHPKKGVDILIKSFARLIEDFNDLVLVVAGPDEIGWRSKLEQLTRKLGITKSVVFTGLVTGAYKKCILKNAEIVVLPSHSEVLSIVALEAMAFSKPLIISEGCGFPEVAEKGAGIIVKPRVEEIGDAMRSVLGKTEKLKQMGKRGRELIEEKYSWQKIASQMNEIYYEAIDMRCINEPS